MTSNLNQIRLANEVAVLVTTARVLGCDADTAAAHLNRPPTRTAVAKATRRLAESERTAPADPFAGLR